MNAIERVIRDHPLLCGMEEDYIRILVLCAERATFRPNQYVFRQGEEADRFYILESGRVALEMETPRYGPVSIDMLGEGEIMGWSWLFPPYFFHYDARVVEETRAVVIDAHYLRARCHEDDHLAHAITRCFAQILMQRLCQANSKLAATLVE